MVDKSKIRAIVIGGSAGSFNVLSDILQALPAHYPIPLVCCMHRLKHIREGFVEALALKSNLKVTEPADKEKLRAGYAYLAPANYHMCFELGYTFAYSTEGMVNFSRPSIDLTFESFGMVLKDKSVGIILSGANQDGAFGLKKMHDYGAFTIVQDPKEAKVTTMPNAALTLCNPNEILDTTNIIKFLLSLQ